MSIIIIMNINNQPLPILVVSATEAECTPTLREITGCKTILPGLHSGTFFGELLEILVTGVGSAAATFRLTQTLMQRRYSRAISIGIAGGFAEDIPIGETVQITEDCFADLGIDNNGQFLNLRDAGLACDDFDGGFILNSSPVRSSHRQLRGITVQTASGSKNRIDHLVERFHPQVETMENAAFFYVCQQMQVPFASFRAISNRVETRNRENWRINDAIGFINENLKQIIRESKKTL